MRYASNSEATMNYNLVVTAIGTPNPAKYILLSTIKIVDCSSGNIISGGDWKTNVIYTEKTISTTTDITINPFTYSKPECGLSSYSIDGYGASINDVNKVRFTSTAEALFSFKLVVTAVGNVPSSKTIDTTIKIVDCSSGNVISGSTW